MRHGAVRHLTIGQTLSIERNGGLVQVVPLHEAMLELSISSRLVYAEWPSSLAPPRQSMPVRVLRRNPFFYGWGTASRLQAAIRDADVVHVHGMYTYLNLLAGAWCARYGKALIYHPHGTLVPEFLKRGRLKKGLALAAFERRNFRQMAAWRALSETEAQQIRQVDPTANVFVIPNGVRLPVDASNVTGEHPRLHVRSGAGQRVFLYLARLSAVKGLDLLLDAWHRAQAQLRGCELWIAGTDRDGTERQLRETSQKLRLSGVSILGPVSEAEKSWLLRACDVFVLPSRGEGQSPALLEAMAYSNPALFTTACFFASAASAHAGVECGLAVESVAAGLVQLASMAQADLDAMGERARTLVAREHDLLTVARTLDQQAGRYWCRSVE